MKEYDWLRDLVEIMEKDTRIQNIFWNIPNFKCFKIMFFVLLQKVKLLNYLEDATPIDFAYAVHTKIGDSLTSCEINGRGSPLQSILKNGDLVKIIGSKMFHHHYNWLSYAKTGKARASIRRYWQNKTKY